jgi:hypothetical protein
VNPETGLPGYRVTGNPENNDKHNFFFCAIPEKEIRVFASPSTSSLTATAFASCPRVQRSFAHTNAALPAYLDMKIFIDGDKISTTCT